MIRNKATFKVRELKKMLNNNTLEWNESIQRCAGVWKPKQKSDLIHSMLEKYYIPSLCLLRTIIPATEEGKKDTSVYSVLDGKQRLSVVFSFIDGDFKLHKTFPLIEKDGEVYDFAGKKFEELPKEFQDDINNYVFEIASLEECTEEEKELLFFRLNDGTPLTKVQKSRATMGGDVAGFLNKLLECQFFEYCNLTTLQKTREDSLTALLQGMMLIDDSYEWNDLGAAEVSKYSEYLKNNCSLLLQVKINETLKLLSHTLSKKNKSLKRINIPIVIKVTYEAIQYNGMGPAGLSDWFEKFFAEDSKYANAYKEYCGEGSVSKEKVLGRINVAVNSLTEILKLKDENKSDDIFNERVAPYLEADKKFIDDSDIKDTYRIYQK